MGASTGIIIIRTNSEKIDCVDVIKSLVSNSFEEVPKGNLFSSKFDTRIDNCFRIFKEEELVIIDNAKFTSSFFKLDSDLVLSLYKYFQKPTHMYAFQEYDDLFGYAFFRSGKLERLYRYVEGKVTSYGNPENIECKWLDLPIIKFEEEGEVYEGFVNPENGITYHKQSLSEFLFSEVFVHEFGFSTWDIGLKSKEVRCFRVK